MTEKEYRKLTRVSYSKLSGLYSSPASLIQQRDVWNDGVMFGSMVDILLFDGDDVFKSKYATVTSTPTDTVKKVIHKLIELNNPFDVGSGKSYPSINNKTLIEAADAVKAYAAMKEETRLKKLLPGKEYYEQLKKADGKVIVEEDDYNKAMAAASTALTHSFTSHYFTPQDGVEIHYQVPVLWEYGTLECKSLFDILIINHNTKTIHPVDFKTTSKSIYKFKQAVTEWNYHIQAAFYTDAIVYAQNNSDAVQRDIIIPSDYTILNFEFVLISQNNVNKPLVWTCTDKFLEVGRSGGNLFYSEVKGYKQLVVDYLWHLANGLYDYPREVYENKGKLLLKTMDETDS